MGQTIEGTVLGTPGYMAPEQARGQIGLIDERTDVYALGAILRYLVTGFDPTRPAAGSPRKAPPPLAAVVQKSQASDPSARYAGALDVAEEVARFLDARPVLASSRGAVGAGAAPRRQVPGGDSPDPGLPGDAAAVPGHP